MDIKEYIQKLYQEHRDAILATKGADWREEAPIFDALERAASEETPARDDKPRSAAESAFGILDVSLAGITQVAAAAIPALTAAAIPAIAPFTPTLPSPAQKVASEDFSLSPRVMQVLATTPQPVSPAAARATPQGPTQADTPIRPTLDTKEPATIQLAPQVTPPPSLEPPAIRPEAASRDDTMSPAIQGVEGSTREPDPEPLRTRPEPPATEETLSPPPQALAAAAPAMEPEPVNPQPPTSPPSDVPATVVQPTQSTSPEPRITPQEPAEPAPTLLPPMQVPGAQQLAERIQAVSQASPATDTQGPVPSGTSNASEDAPSPEPLSFQPTPEPVVDTVTPPGQPMQDIAPEPTSIIQNTNTPAQVPPPPSLAPQGNNTPQPTPERPTIKSLRQDQSPIVAPRQSVRQPTREEMAEVKGAGVSKMLDVLGSKPQQPKSQAPAAAPAGPKSTKPIQNQFPSSPGIGLAQQFSSSPAFSFGQVPPPGPTDGHASDEDASYQAEVLAGATEATVLALMQSLDRITAALLQLNSRLTIVEEVLERSFGS